MGRSRALATPTGATVSVSTMFGTGVLMSSATGVEDQADARRLLADAAEVCANFEMNERARVSIT